MHGIRHIALAYARPIRLNRMAFLVGLTVWLIAALIIGVVFVYAAGAASLQETSYFVGKSIVELITLLMLTPLLFTRLRDVGWSLLLVVTFYLAWGFSLRNLVLATLWRGTEFVPTWQIAISVAFGVISLVLLILLLAKRSPASHIGR